MPLDTTGEPTVDRLLRELSAAGDLDALGGFETILRAGEAAGADHLRSAEGTSVYASPMVGENGVREDRWFKDRLNRIEQEFAQSRRNKVRRRLLRDD